MDMRIQFSRDGAQTSSKHSKNYRPVTVTEMEIKLRICLMHVSWSWSVFKKEPEDVEDDWGFLK